MCRPSLASTSMPRMLTRRGSWPWTSVPANTRGGAWSVLISTVISVW